MKTFPFLFILLLLLSPLCAQAVAPETGFTDPSKPIYVNKKNPTIKIVLKANPTTGFSWFLKEFDPVMVIPVSAVFIPPKEAIPGRGGISVWTFRINPAALTVPTLTSIKLIYTQPWSVQKDNPGETFTIVTSPTKEAQP